MKKLTALLLALVLVLAFAACDVSSLPELDLGAPPTQSEDKPTSESNATPTNSEVAPETDEAETQPPAAEQESNELSFTELVALDNEECLIKITGIDSDSFWGYSLKVLLENKSSEKTYMFSLQRASVNGVDTDPLFAQEVAPGKKANEEIVFMDDTLEENGIIDYTDIELTFRVHDSDDWMADEVALETVHVYPYGEEKAVKFVREAQPTDNIILDNEYITVIVTGYENDSIWGFSTNVFLINHTDKNIIFSVDDASVNGFMADPLFAKTVAAGKCAFGSITWFDSTLEENNITAVEEIEFTLRAYDSDDWLADDFAKETITLIP